MITKEIRLETFERARGKCENPSCLRKHDFDSETWEYHHIHFKSQYSGQDRDESWNGAILCGETCHRGAHGVHGVNEYLDAYLKAKADRRKPKEKRVGGRHKDLIRESKRRKSEYSKKIDEFKKNNGGLSPSQVEYRKRKEYLKKALDKKR